MKRIPILFLLILIVLPVFGHKYTISGYLKDRSSGEALIGATAYIKELKTGVVSNMYGFYSITVPDGKYTVVYSYVGYEPDTKKIQLNQNKEVNINLAESKQEIKEVVVSGEKKNHNVESINMSMNKLPVKMVKKLPAFMGEVDILKSLQLLPGIESGGEGSSSLYVRGGGPDENLLLLDEAPVYNASHLFGFFSVFNSDAIKDVQVYKGGIPAKYGGKASSVIDIRMKDGNSHQFHAEGGIGDISSRLTIEGPIIKDKWSYIISGRRTYADVLARMVGIKQVKNNALYFYDLNGKTNIQLSNKDHFFISTYSGSDYMKYGSAFYMRWGNITGTLRWSHVFGDKLFSNASAIYSKYIYDLGTPSGAAQFDWTSQIRDYHLKDDFTWFLDPQNKIEAGFNVIYHHFVPGILKADSGSYYSNLTLTDYNAVESALYLSNEQKIGGRLTLRYGLRYSMFQQLGKGEVREYLDPQHPNANQIIGVKNYSQGQRIGPSYNHPEPRLAVKFTLDRNSSIKASYNRMVQNLHLISNTNSPTPLNIWLPTSKYIKPLIADQVGLGYFRNFMNNAIESSVEVYYKKMHNVLDYKDGAQLFFNENIETELLNGKGNSYGLEMLVKKQQGKFTGWISYTLARTTRQVPGINNGKPYPSAYDHTHDISIILSYDLTKNLTASANWVFITGNPTSYPAAKYDVQGNTIYYYSGRNSNRIPDYHRLDVSLNYDLKKNEKRKYKQSFNFSLYNVYARRNAYSVTFHQNPDNPNISQAERLSIFGTVIPSITYNFNF